MYYYLVEEVSTLKGTEAPVWRYTAFHKYALLWQHYSSVILCAVL